MLSLDVVAGTVLCCLFAFRLLHVDSGPVYPFVLALSVWVLYTADHLVDAFRLKERAHTERHRFYHRHFSLFLVLVLAGAPASVGMTLLFLDRGILYFGLITGIIGGIYLGVVHRVGGRKHPVPKELLVAIIYTAGVWGGPVLLSGQPLAAGQWLAMASFLLLVFCGILLLSILDHDADLLDRHTTIAVNYGLKSAFMVFYVLMVIILLASIALLFGPWEYVGFVSKLTLV